MRPVYVAGRGLASVLGPDLDAAISAMRAGGVAPARVTVTNEFTWPQYRIAREPADDGLDWSARSARLARRVAAESGALHGARTGPLFIASSSVDIGDLETSSDFHGHYQRFPATVGTASKLAFRSGTASTTQSCRSAGRRSSKRKR